VQSASVAEEVNRNTYQLLSWVLALGITSRGFAAVEFLAVFTAGAAEARAMRPVRKVVVLMMS
jgi:hypothetical protein